MGEGQMAIFGNVSISSHTSPPQKAKVYVTKDDVFVNDKSVTKLFQEVEILKLLLLKSKLISQEDIDEMMDTLTVTIKLEES